MTLKEAIRDLRLQVESPNPKDFLTIHRTSGIAILQTLTEKEEGKKLDWALFTNVEILLESSKEGVYVNDEQRIGFQKGAKWVRDFFKEVIRIENAIQSPPPEAEIKTAEEYYETLDDKKPFSKLTPTGISDDLESVFEFSEAYARYCIVQLKKSDKNS